MKVVVNGAGAAGLSCAKMFLSVGIKKENLILCDKEGVIRSNYPGGVRDVWKPFINDSGIETLSDAIKGADMFMGLSAKGVLKKEMLLAMANDPIVFAMANPDPEITYDDAKATRDDVIIATGRSDYPNQINNVLGFPAIFRGALDVRATRITENMKRSAAFALAALAREDVPEAVFKAYGGKYFAFGRDYIVPKPFDPRVVPVVATAVAEAAIKDKVARITIDDFDEYKKSLEKRLG